LDTNTWIALTVESHPQNGVARRWYDSAPLSGGDLLFCRATETSFLRLITQKSAMACCGIEPLSNLDAVTFLGSVYGDPPVACAAEPIGIRQLWLGLAAVPSASPHVWMDAYLAAFAIGLDATFVTFDRAFTRFVTNGLRLELLQPA
jgi:toxin-antitoxin system PIN domain toxin